MDQETDNQKNPAGAVTAELAKVYRQMGKYQSWNGFTTQLFQGKRRQYLEVIYHLNREVLDIYAVHFLEHSNAAIYWGAPIHCCHLWLPCKTPEGLPKPETIYGLLDPTLYLNLVFKPFDERDVGSNPELVIAHVDQEDVEYRINTYWVYSHKDTHNIRDE